MNEFSSFSPEHRSEGSAETEKAETSSKELGIKKEGNDFDAIFQRMNRAEEKPCYAGTEREGTERGELFRENKSVGENPEMTDKVRSIIKDSHEEAKEVSFSATEGKLNGRYFTDHKEAHVEMVAEKAREAGEAISAAVRDGGFKGEKDENRIAFSSKIDYAVLEGAGLSHDTGMNGKGYKIIENEKGYTAEKLNENNFDEIRQNHSLNSAIHVLENRDKYRDAGYSDEQIDKIAVECMAHSKRSSGVTDLNSKEAWSACFDRMDTAVEAYNKEHEGKEISFDRERLESSDEKMGSLASETLAIRIGDVSRDSYFGAESQSGEKVELNRSLLGRGESWQEEVGKKESVTIGENHEPMDNDFSRRAHAGEQNIRENHCISREGTVVHSVKVSDGNLVPSCTQEALREHVGELKTASDGKFLMEVHFDRPCDETSKSLYKNFERSINAELQTEKNQNIKVKIIWDHE